MDNILTHYGDTLAEKLRKSTQDFSKLTAFDKFVLDEGYRFATKEELQAGYDRNWKANHDILVTLEEFLEEAEKEPDTPAADTYKALVKLVEEKKIRPREVLGYARCRWCLNRPEAVIAYQTERDKWSVNNCDTEITEEQARIKVGEEWGFKEGCIRIIGTPYYESTDWQFICFDCAHMTWLWCNEAIYQVFL